MSFEQGELLEFPCNFPLKVIGLANEQFETAVYSIVRKHLAELSEAAIKMRYSQDKKYLSLTVNAWVVSREQLDAIYIDLSSHEAIMMVL